MLCSRQRPQQTAELDCDCVCVYTVCINHEARRRSTVAHRSRSHAKALHQRARHAGFNPRGDGGGGNTDQDVIQDKRAASSLCRSQASSKSQASVLCHSHATAKPQASCGGRGITIYSQGVTYSQGSRSQGSRSQGVTCGKGTAAAPCVGAAAGVTAAAVGLHEEATGGGSESERRTARCAGCWRDVIVLRCDGAYTGTRLGHNRDTTQTPSSLHTPLSAPDGAQRFVPITRKLLPTTILRLQHSPQSKWGGGS